MIDPDSRYADVGTAMYTASGPDGEPRPVRYLLRRPLPPPDAGETLLEHTVSQGDRLDNLTARYLGDPTQFWRVCDANNVVCPFELTAEPGRRVRITLPLGT